MKKDPLIENKKILKTPLIKCQKCLILTRAVRFGFSRVIQATLSESVT